MSDNVNNYELCMRAESVELPAEGYFGVSAATGGLAGLASVQLFCYWTTCSLYDFLCNSCCRRADASFSYGSSSIIPLNIIVVVTLT